MKKILDDEMLNTRDIGGYETTDGLKKIKYNKLIRSNVPTELSEVNLTYLLENNINIAIDLRNDTEIKEKVAVFKNDSRFKYYHFQVNGLGRIPKNKKDVSNSYLEMTEGFDVIYNIFKIILDGADNGVIYFCNAGKDRTGVITALIMMLVGIGKEDIIKDYVLSSEYLNDLLNAFIKDNECLRDIVIPRKEFMEKFILLFNDKYESIEKYLNLVGFDYSEIEMIKEKLLEKR